MLARTATSATLALVAAVLLAPAGQSRAEGNAKSLPAPAVEAAGAATVDAERTPTRVRGVAGKVSDEASPLSSAKVYLYRVSDLSLVKAVTDERGHFLFDTLPAGLYKVIAHKAGFVPAVVQLTRTTAEAYQFLELELAAARQGAEARSEDFWSLRSQVPTDVLRDIQLAEIQDQTRRAGSAAQHSGVFLAGDAAQARLGAHMTAMTGTDDSAGGEGQVTRGEVGIEGRIGSLRLDLSGDYLELAPSPGHNAGGPSGSAHNLSLSARDDNMVVRIDSRNDQLLTPESRGQVGFEAYRLAVSHDIGERGRSDFIAQYSSETNFHRHGWVDPRAIPEESRSWRLEGTYTAELTDRASLQTGVRYRQLSSGFGFGDQTAAGTSTGLAPEWEEVDLFSRAGMQVKPSVLVEYGLYTTLRDGSVSLSPRGGLVFQLSPAWQAAMAASYKVHEEGDAPYADFMPTVRSPEALEDSCEQNDAHCYQVVFTHQPSDRESLSLGASHRSFDETQRVYFSDELMDRFESLYLVPGDEIPEIHFDVTRQLSPTVTTRFQSNVANGGGGVFLATDSQPYENQVSYLVTSLDTRFGGTSTGLFVAFHRLEQVLQRTDASDRPSPEMDVERLELMLTQDLNFLLNMATEMAVQLNMQVSRGSWPFVTEASQQDEDELRKRLMGGIALRF